MFTYPVSLPAAARAHIDDVILRADETFEAAKQQSMVSDGDLGFFYRPEDDGVRDAAAVAGLVGVIHDVVQTLSRVAKRAQWSDATRWVAVDDLVEQRIEWVFAHQSSRTKSHEAFYAHVYAALDKRPWWRQVQTASQPVGVVEGQPRRRAARIASYRQQAAWLRAQMDLVGFTTPNRLEVMGGPSGKTTKRILQGFGAREDPWRKIVTALNEVRRTKGLKLIAFEDVPSR